MVCPIKRKRATGKLILIFSDVCVQQCEWSLQSEQWNNKFSHNLCFVIKNKDEYSNEFYIMLSIMEHIELVLKEVVSSVIKTLHDIIV